MDSTARISNSIFYMFSAYSLLRRYFLVRLCKWWTTGAPNWVGLRNFQTSNNFSTIWGAKLTLWYWYWFLPFRHAWDHTQVIKILWKRPLVKNVTASLGHVFALLCPYVPVWRKEILPLLSLAVHIPSKVIPTERQSLHHCENRFKTLACLVWC